MDAFAKDPTFVAMHLPPVPVHFVPVAGRNLKFKDANGKAAAAGVLHSQLRWPNDLTFDGRKLGGILSEIVVDPRGRRVPVVGLGINLNQAEFAPEIAEVATSLHRLRGGSYDPEAIARKILDRFIDLPEPTSWNALEPAWSLFDRTPGKLYRLPNGEFAVALGVGSDGQLIASVDGESVSVLAADAIFGATT